MSSASLNNWRSENRGAQVSDVKRLKRQTPDPLDVPRPINTVSSIDFMHDQLADGRQFPTFDMLDDYTRDDPWIEVDL